MNYEVITNPIKKSKIMSKKIAIVLGLAFAISFAATAQDLLTKTGKITFKSTTEAENIESSNFKVTSKLNTETGVMVFSVPMQSFELEPAMRYKHFNSVKFLDTKTYPKSKFKGAIINISDIDLSKDGTYNAVVKGDLTMHGVTKPVDVKGTLTVKGGVIKGLAKFNVLIADYKISFEKGKPSTNVAKEIEISVDLDYKKL